MNIKSTLTLFLAIVISGLASAQAPVVSSFTPRTVLPGETIKISGSNFGSGTNNNAVFFGPVKGQITAASDKEITVTVPVGATYDQIRVLNQQTHLYGQSNTCFSLSTSSPANSLNAEDFTSKSEVAGISATTFAASDLNNDGKPDLMGMSSTSSIVIMQNASITGIINSKSFVKKASLPLPVSGYFPAIQAADLDGDGKAEIIVIDQAGNKVTIFKNNITNDIIDENAFSQKISIATSVEPAALVVRDVDGDGRLDLATLNLTANSISIFRNQGGVFGEAMFTKQSDIHVDGYPRDFLIEDLNNDGSPEIIVCSGSWQTIYAFQNKNAGKPLETLDYSVKTTLATGALFRDMAIGDFNNDGKNDLVTGVIAVDYISVLINESPDGAGLLFKPKMNFPTGLNAYNVDVGDLDGDGAADIVVSDGTVAIIRNNSSPTQTSFEKGGSFLNAQYSHGIDLVDIDGDGKLDFVAGAGTYTSILLYKNNVVPKPEISSILPAKAAANDDVVISGKNFNADPSKSIVYFGGVRATVKHAGPDRIDVVVPTGASYGTVSVLNTETQRNAYSSIPFSPIFASKQSITSSDFSTERATANTSNNTVHAMGDLDNDGRTDMVYNVNTLNQIVCMPNTPDMGTYYFLFNEEIKLVTNDKPVDLKLADFDSDGLLDIVVCNQDNKSFSIFRNTSTTGKISFAPRIDHYITTTVNAVFTGLHVTDVNNDGKQDIILYGNYLLIFSNASLRAQLLFTAADPIPITSTRRLSSGDLNGDGKPELIRSGEGISIMENRSAYGKISFAADISLALPGAIAETADINQDNKLDLVYTYGNHLVTALNSYPGTGALSLSHFSTRTDDTTIDRPLNTLKVADMDGDGNLDVVGSTFTAKTISVFRNTSTPEKTSFAFRTDLNTRYEPLNITLCDLNMDNLPDIILSERTLFSYFNLPQTLAQSTPPVITGFNNRPGTNTSFDIEGTGFNPKPGDNLVRIGTIAASVNSISATRINVTTPKNALNGKISIYNKANKLTGYSSDIVSTTFSSNKFSSEKDFEPFVKLFDNPTDSYEPNNMAFADFDEDKKPDLLIGVSGMPTIYRNTSVIGTLNTASFSEKTEFPLIGTFEPVIVEDLSGDGSLDFVFGQRVTVKRNDSDLERNRLQFSNGVFYQFNQRGIAVTDLDLDGKPDIISKDMAGPESGVLNISKNISQENNPDFLRQISQFDYDASNGILRTADVDGDGRPDLIFPYYGQIAIALNNTEKYYITAAPLLRRINFLAGAYAADVRTCDLNNDGKPDLVTLNKDKTISILQNKSTIGHVVFSDPILIPAGRTLVNVDFGDTDGDGYLDMIGAGAGNYLTLFHNAGVPGDISKATFGAPSRIPAGVDQTNVRFVDADLDGKLDIVYCGTSYVGAIKGNPRNYPGIQLSKSIVKYASAGQPLKLDEQAVLKYETGNLDAAKIRISGNYKPGQDKLDFISTSQTGSISAVFDPQTGTLSLSSASATIAQWENALKSVSYTNTSANPDLTNRELTWQVSDNTLLSNEPVTEVRILGVPVITSFTPKSGIKGTIITITGSNFEDITSVQFGGVSVESFNVVSSTQIVTALATGGSGNVTVQNPAGTGTIAGFVFVPVPVISADGPTTFLSGKQVTLKADSGPQFTYKWTKNGQSIGGAFTDTFIARETGNYEATIVYPPYQQTSNTIAVEAMYVLPADNFMVSAISVSCKGSSNGSITIKALEELNYELNLSMPGGIIYRTFFNKNFTVANLKAGIYKACLRVGANAEQCFDIVVGEPKDLTLYATVNQSDENVTVRLSGASMYYIELNGRKYQTTDNQITLPLIEGDNKIKLSSDLICQGTIEEKVQLLPQMTVYPNPVDRILNISFGDQRPSAIEVSVTNMLGGRVFSGKYANENKLAIDLSGLSSGMYVVSIIADKVVTTKKIIKN